MTERQDKGLNTRIGKASAVMRALNYSATMKRELSKKAKLSIIKTVFSPFSPMGNDRKSAIANASVRTGPPRGGAGGYNDPGAHGLQEARWLQRAQQRAHELERGPSK